MVSCRPSPLVRLNLQPSLSFFTSHQPRHAMNQDFQAEVVAVCKDTRNKTRRTMITEPACTSARSEVRHPEGSRARPHNSRINHAQRPHTPVPPRIAKMLHHFVEERTMYLVMEHITLQEFPPDIARIQNGCPGFHFLPIPR